MVMAMLPFLPLLGQAVAALTQDAQNDEELRQALRDHVRISEAMAVSIFHIAANSLPDPPPPDRPVNPYAVGLDPDRWEADGLYDSPGLTLDQARQVPSTVASGAQVPVGATPGEPAG